KQLAYVQQQCLLLANGRRNLLEIGTYLGLDTAQTADLAVQLYRQQRLEIQSGILEFERLLEHY
ncbi:MAG: hypothetical protein ACK41E_07305, partial [Deinococcales bacterium]